MDAAAPGSENLVVITAREREEESTVGFQYVKNTVPGDKMSQTSNLVHPPVDKQYIVLFVFDTSGVDRKKVPVFR